MFNEGEDMRKLFGTEAFVEKQKENYPLLNQYFGRINVHFFNDKPFLIHAKGGTGLAKVARLKQFLKEANESFIH